MSAGIDESIEVVDYDPAWTSQYIAEATRVRSVLGARAACIEHVGSTAVPGIPGKPIVDLLVGVHDMHDAVDAATALGALGYEDFGEVFLAGRRYLRRRGPPHFNVAITATGSDFHRTQLAVRDFLRAHPAEMLAYSKVKRDAWAAGARMFSSYSQFKHDFVVQLVARARTWADAGPGPRSPDAHRP